MELAVEQHHCYERELRALGCLLERLSPEPRLPDSVFVEDTAVVLDELAIITRPGAVSRHAEIPSAAAALRAYRPIAQIAAPATLDGGDVVRTDRKLFVGRTARSNEEGIRQLRELASPLGYSVETVTVRGCLHLKSAVTRVAEEVVLVNPEWIDASAFWGLHQIEVDPQEPAAANALSIGTTALVSSAYPRTAQRLERHGLTTRALDMSELAKAEGALTCCSLIFSI
jgi:dimethylargininase